MLSRQIELLRADGGAFLCESIGASSDTKIEKFLHKFTKPTKMTVTSEVAEIIEFYHTSGSALLYFCPESDEAAYYIARIEEWGRLEEGLSDWIDMLDDIEQAEALPDWFGNHTVIGEVPASGNYLLVVEKGIEAGSIYLFDHDGFELYKLGDSLSDFIKQTLEPNPQFLASMASHMRFVTDDDYSQQWWIKELRSNSGRVVMNPV
jgi:hypothetical protein